MSAREEILERIRSAQSDSAATVSVTPAPEPEVMEVEAMLDLFVENLRDYRAIVREVAPGELQSAVDAVLSEHHATTVVVPDDLPASMMPTSAEVTIDDGLSAERLNRIAAVVTTSAVGIAITGTIVLDHVEGQARRALSLVPDVHICVVRADQVVTSVPEAIARLRRSVEAGRPLTWISGPSATSDIELNRVEGVHGPRNLEVILVR